MTGPAAKLGGRGRLPGWFRRTGGAGLGALLAWITGPSLLAQGCAMCKSSIAAQNDSVVASINTGILILLIPPLGILSTILYFAFRARD